MARKLFPTTLVLVLALLLPSAGAFAAQQPVNKAPVVTAFDVPDNSASPLPVLTFTATDSDGTIVGYLITESPTRPGASDPRWSATTPAEYITTSVGAITLYAWAKDNRAAISNGLSDVVTIPLPPVNADTLDGLDSTEFAAAYHTHDDAYQGKHANVVTVAKSGGDFTDLIGAVNSISDASATNPYLVKIMPGVYDLGNEAMLQMKAYVDIEGSGRDLTTITGYYSYNSQTATTAMIKGIANADLRNLTVHNNGAGFALCNPYHVEDVTITGGGIQFHKKGFDYYPSVIRNVDLYGRGINNWYNLQELTCENITITAEGGIWSWHATRQTYKNVRINGASNQAMSIIDVQDLVLDGVTATHAGIGIDIFCINSAVLKNVDVSASSGWALSFGGYPRELTTGFGKMTISNSRFVAAADGVVGLRVNKDQTAVLDNVYVNTADTGTGAALSILSTGNVQSFDGRFIGDATVDSSTGVLKAANSQFTGALPGAGVVKLTNCFDGNFDPILNQ